jgi:hypothetical protein
MQGALVNETENLLIILLSRVKSQHVAVLRQAKTLKTASERGRSGRPLLPSEFPEVDFAASQRYAARHPGVVQALPADDGMFARSVLASVFYSVSEQIDNVRTTIMSLFVDRLLVQLSDPVRLSQVLLPAIDPAPTRVRRLVDAAYAFPFATVQDVNLVTISRIETEQPIFPPQRTRGTWTQTIPSHQLTDVAYEGDGPLQPFWLDVAAELQLKLLLEADPGAVDTLFTSEIADFATLADFRARFSFLNVDELLSRHNITTVDELREHYHFLQTEIRLRAPAPFDPTDPANQHAFALNVAFLIRETLDVRAVLQEAKLLRAALERAIAFRRDLGPAELLTPYALVVILPDASLTGQPLTANDLAALFTAERILVLFLTPA